MFIRYTRIINFKFIVWHYNHFFDNSVPRPKPSLWSMCKSIVTRHFWMSSVNTVWNVIKWILSSLYMWLFTHYYSRWRIQLGNVLSKLWKKADFIVSMLYCIMAILFITTLCPFLNTMQCLKLHQNIARTFYVILPWDLVTIQIDSSWWYINSSAI